MTPANEQAEKRQALKDRFAHLRDNDREQKPSRADELKERLATAGQNRDRTRDR